MALNKSSKKSVFLKLTQKQQQIIKNIDILSKLMFLPRMKIIYMDQTEWKQIFLIILCAICYDKTMRTMYWQIQYWNEHEKHTFLHFCYVRSPIINSCQLYSSRAVLQLKACRTKHTVKLIIVQVPFGILRITTTTI